MCNLCWLAQRVSNSLAVEYQSEDEALEWRATKWSYQYFMEMAPMTQRNTGSCARRSGPLDRLWMTMSRKSSWNPPLGVVRWIGTWDSCWFLKEVQRKNWMKSIMGYLNNSRSPSLRLSTLPSWKKSSNSPMKKFGTLINDLRHWLLELTSRWAMFSTRSGSPTFLSHITDNC